MQIRPSVPVEVATDGSLTQAGAPLGKLEVMDFPSGALLNRVPRCSVRSIRSKPESPCRLLRYTRGLPSRQRFEPEAAARLIVLTRQFESLQRAMTIGAEMNRKRSIDQARESVLKGDQCMIRALYSAASGMTAQQLNVDNIAHNLANANTVGFKDPAHAVSGSALSEYVQPGLPLAASQTMVPTGLQIGLGSRPRRTRSSSRRATFQTDNPLDHGDPGQGILSGPPALANSPTLAPAIFTWTATATW